MQQVILKSNKDLALKYLPNDLYDYILNEACGYFECHNGQIIITFDLYNESDSAPDEKISIYYTRDVTVFLCGTEESLSRISALTSGERSSLYAFFSALLRAEPMRLQKLECKINAIEERLIRYSDSECMPEILDLKYEIFDLKAYYTQLISIFEECNENENGVFDEESAKSFGNLQSRGEKLLNSTLELRDYLSQARDACQSQIEIEQNKLMKIFTVITALFLPLNLLVGWYGMNFTHMPELAYPGAYTIFTVVCVVIALTLILFFRKRKWFK